MVFGEFYDGVVSSSDMPIRRIMIEKLTVLATIAEMFNSKNITWALGGSAMLYLRGMVDQFDDLDIVISEGQEQVVEKLLVQMGECSIAPASEQFRSKCFKSVVDNVKVDVISGFTIVCDGISHYLPLDTADIDMYMVIDDCKIYLHSIEVWRIYYSLMGRTAKVSLIDDAIGRMKG